MPPTSQTPASANLLSPRKTPVVPLTSTIPLRRLWFLWAKTGLRLGQDDMSAVNIDAQLLAGPNGSEGRSRLSRTEEKLVEFF